MPSAYTVDMCIYINIFDIWITQPNTLDWTDEKKNNNHATATAHPNPLACDSLFFASVSISLSLFLSLFFGVTLNTARFYSTSSVYSSLFFCPSNVIQFHNISRWLGVFLSRFFTISVIQSIDVVSIRYCSLLFVHIITMNNFYLQLFGFECTFPILRSFIFQLFIIKKRDVYIRIWHSYVNIYKALYM